MVKTEPVPDFVDVGISQVVGISTSARHGLAKIDYAVLTVSARSGIGEGSVAEETTAEVAKVGVKCGLVAHAKFVLDGISLSG